MFRSNDRWYFNDQWRVTPNLTLNLGVPWEYDRPFYDNYNRLSNFDPSSGQLIIAGQNFVSRIANVRSDWFRWNNYGPFHCSFSWSRCIRTHCGACSAQRMWEF
jgi:hypothetical protein